MAGSVGKGRAALRSSPKRYSGTDPPLSLAGPTLADLQRTAELEKFLVEAGLYEGKEESAKREDVLSEIGQIVKEWVKQLTSKKGYADQLVEQANAVLFTFGSYRLGVHGPEADIDTLCVGPSYVNREEDFFVTLHDILVEKEEVTELQPVPDAHVPVLKFKFRGISIDLLILISLKDLCFVMLMKQQFEVLMDAEWRIRFFGLFQMLRLYETAPSTLSCMVWSHCVSIPNFVLCRISGQHSDA